jgi:hypothetical protein
MAADQRNQVHVCFPTQVVNASPEDQAKAIERAQKAREAGMDQYFTKGWAFA